MYKFKSKNELIAEINAQIERCQAQIKHRQQNPSGISKKQCEIDITYAQGQILAYQHCLEMIIALPMQE